MEYHFTNNLEQVPLPGRGVRKSVGSDGAIHSSEMTFGRTTFSLKFGPMQPHHHAEELIYVLNTTGGVVRFGPTEACEGGSVQMEPDMLLHFANQEWHVFEFSDEKGYADILFFYGQTGDLRPEDKK